MAAVKSLALAIAVVGATSSLTSGASLDGGQWRWQYAASPIASLSNAGPAFYYTPQRFANAGIGNGAQAQVQSVASPVAAPAPPSYAADAFLNFGNGPYADASLL